MTHMPDAHWPSLWQRSPTARSLGPHAASRNTRVRRLPKRMREWYGHRASPSPPEVAGLPSPVMTIRKTSPHERVDMMLAQAERFIVNDLPGEAIARAKQAIAYCDEEGKRAGGVGPQLTQRKLLAESILMRLGHSVRNRQGDLNVDAEDALHFEAWAAD